MRVFSFQFLFFWWGYSFHQHKVVRERVQLHNRATNKQTNKQAKKEKNENNEKRKREGHATKRRNIKRNCLPAVSIYKETRETKKKKEKKKEKKRKKVENERKEKKRKNERKLYRE